MNARQLNNIENIITNFHSTRFENKMNAIIIKRQIYGVVDQLDQEFSDFPIEYAEAAKIILESFNLLSTTKTVIERK